MRKHDGQGVHSPLTRVCSSSQFNTSMEGLSLTVTGPAQWSTEPQGGRAMDPKPDQPTPIHVGIRRGKGTLPHQRRLTPHLGNS